MKSNVEKILYAIKIYYSEMEIIVADVKIFESFDWELNFEAPIEAKN